MLARLNLLCTWWACRGSALYESACLTARNVGHTLFRQVLNPAASSFGHCSMHPFSVPPPRSLVASLSGYASFVSELGRSIEAWAQPS